MSAVFETGADLGLVEGEKMMGVKNRLGLNKKPIFLVADLATEEMCSFMGQVRFDRLSHIFRVFLIFVILEFFLSKGTYRLKQGSRKTRSDLVNIKSIRQ